MKKLFFIALVALAAVSCKSKGIQLDIQNNSGADISNVVCYTVISGDTLLTSDLIKNNENASVSFPKTEGKTSYNFILEFVRANGYKDTTIESITLSEESKIAQVHFIVDETSIKTDFKVE
ncbi:MAG: hypothetical protein ACK5JS_02015 [Mangrovibacterium sp.]